MLRVLLVKKRREAKNAGGVALSYKVPVVVFTSFYDIVGAQ